MNPDAFQENAVADIPYKAPSFPTGASPGPYQPRPAQAPSERTAELGQQLQQRVLQANEALHRQRQADIVKATARQMADHHAMFGHSGVRQVVTGSLLSGVDPGYIKNVAQTLYNNGQPSVAASVYDSLEGQD
jgi:hypothetical protein